MSRRPALRFAVAVALAAGGLALAAPAGAARDPMRPPVPAAGAKSSRSAPEPVLSAIIGSAARRVAIVDGRVVRAGDRIGGVEILAVFDDGIRYSRAGIVRELKLPAPVAMKRPAGTASAGPGSGK